LTLDIKMFLLRTNINPNQNIQSGLKRVYGLNNALILQLCRELGLNTALKFKDVKKSQLGLITKWVDEKNVLIKDDLQKFVLDNKKQLIAIKTYRGSRHKEGLPTRGQRTHTNARTQRKLTSFKSKKKNIQKT
jgi:small subunit ribosomal protein S13